MYRRFAAFIIALLVAMPFGTGVPAGQARSAAVVPAPISEQEVREYLTYIASDGLEGRATYTEGLGLAAAYIAQHLTEWGLQPGGDNGTYFQRVPNYGVRTTRQSTVTVTAGGETRTFRDAEGFLLPANQGGRQTLTFEAVEFAGYGLSVPEAKHDDYAGAGVKGKLVMIAGRTPSVLRAAQYGRLVNARGRFATEMKGAAAVIQATGFTAPAAQAAPAPAGRGGRGGAPVAPDFTTAQRYDRPIPPVVTAGDELAAFILSAAPGGYAEIKRKADAGEPLGRLTIPATVRIDVAPVYDVVRTQFSRNVIGVVPGADPALRETFVAFGAHYDHVGVIEGAARPNPRARPDDRIFNGADDDGSGTVALMAIARAFAQGERPKRSLMFVWHTAEEGGLRGSRYNAEQVDPAKMAAVLNIDMIGRNANDDPANANQVFIIGGDRISTELHNINEDANASLPKPLGLDYALNDPADPESLYTRSDHYSYAARGIPIVFFFTGLHPDYHQVSDEVEKINFEKLARVARLVAETGRRVANLDQVPVRDNRGPRAGKGFRGKLK